MATAASFDLEFRSFREARDFCSGFCVPRVVVQLSRRRYAIVSPSTARRRRLKVVW